MGLEIDVIIMQQRSCARPAEGLLTSFFLHHLISPLPCPPQLRSSKVSRKFLYQTICKSINLNAAQSNRKYSSSQDSRDTKVKGLHGTITRRHNLAKGFTQEHLQRSPCPGGDQNLTSSYTNGISVACTTIAILGITLTANTSTSRKQETF